MAPPQPPVDAARHSAAAASPAPATLAEVLRPHAVPLADVKARYPFIAMLRTMLGAVPNFVCLTDVFPPAFETENVIVPALLNLPASMFWLGTDLRQAGLCMFAAARQAGCQYCVLHCATFSLRRGLAEDALLLKNLTPEEEACMELGRALGAVPCTMNRETYQAIVEAKGSEAGAESIMLAAVMMGWLCRVMDSFGLDMEETLVKEVGEFLKQVGWTTGRHRVTEPQGELQQADAGGSRRGDGFKSRTELLQCAPHAALFDMRATAGVPCGADAVFDFLQDAIGCGFPVLRKITSASAWRGIAVALAKNSVSPECTIHLAIKALIGEGHAVCAENPKVAQAMTDVFRHASVLEGGSASYDESLVTLVRAEAAKMTTSGDACDDDWTTATCLKFEEAGLCTTDAAVLVLCLSASTSPVRVTPPVVHMASQALSPSEIVEAISWLGCVSMIVRLEEYYAASSDAVF